MHAAVESQTASCQLNSQPLQERIVDYRTRVSGVTPEDMLRAKPFKEVQAAAREVLAGRILVGHSVDHDLQVSFATGKRVTRDSCLSMAVGHTLSRPSDATTISQICSGLQVLQLQHLMA